MHFSLSVSKVEHSIWVVLYFLIVWHWYVLSCWVGNIGSVGVPESPKSAFPPPISAIHLSIYIIWLIIFVIQQIIIIKYSTVMWVIYSIYKINKYILFTPLEKFLVTVSIVRRNDMLFWYIINIIIFLSCLNIYIYIFFFVFAKYLFLVRRTDKTHDYVFRCFCDDIFCLYCNHCSYSLRIFRPKYYTNTRYKFSLVLFPVYTDIISWTTDIVSKSLDILFFSGKKIIPSQHIIPTHIGSRDAVYRRGLFNAITFYI